MANLKPSKAVGNLRINGSLIDNKNFSGFSGGLLKSTGTETVWDFGGIAVVVLVARDSTSLSSVTISDIAVGDLVLFFGAENSDNQSAPTGGWTSIPGLGTQPDNDGVPNSAAFYKIATGTSETASGLTGTDTTYIMVALRGVDTTTPFDVNAVQNAASSGLPNSPSITTVTDGCLILSVGIIDDDNVAELIDTPAGYRFLKVFDDEGTSGTGSAGNTIAIAGKQQFAAGSEDPPAFTGSSSDDNKGYTIALRPKLPSVSGALSYIKCVGNSPTAITYVGGTSQEDTTNDLTLTGLQSGDLVLFFSASDGENQSTPNSGWIAVNGTGSQPDNDGDPDSAAFYKFSTGTSVTASNLEENSVHVMIAFRDVDTTDPFGSTASRSSSSGMPDPASITVNNANSMVLIVGLLDDDDIASSVTAPTGYTLAVVQDTDSDDCTVMTAYKSLTGTGSEDPGTFGGSGSDSYKAYTLELKIKPNIKIDNTDASNTYFTPSWLNLTPVFSSGSWTVTNSTIEVPNTGLYLINVNWELTTDATTDDRVSPQVAIAINGTPNVYVSAHTYMRAASGHNSSSSNQSTLMELDSGDLVSVQWLESTTGRDDVDADTNLTEDSSFIEILQLK
jgi:hypothetical protein